MRNLLLLLLLCLGIGAARAQTFTGTGGAVPDNGTLTPFALPVSGLPTATSAGFGLQSVRLNVTHPLAADLRLQVQAPTGEVVDLSLNNGWGANYANTVFVGTGTAAIFRGSPPFAGTYRAQGILGCLNNGQNPNGTWQLLVRDTAPGDVGAVVSWALTFSTSPAPPFAFTSSSLPIVLIDTGSGVIVDEPKINARMGIISHAPGVPNNISDAPNAYRNRIGIELRGNASQWFPQKSYGIETRDVNNVEHDTTLLGMPSDNSWILYAPYNDKTCFRNVLSYQLANRMGRYAARTRYCELVLNGQYQGIYVLMEKIKRGSNRVNIKKLEAGDTTGNKLTGGYIFKIDHPAGNGGNLGWNSNYPSSTGATIRFLYDTPKSTDIKPQQARYLKAYVDSVETALASPGFANPATGYAKYIDVPSFVDYFLLNELSRNPDGLRLSTYLYKNRRSEGGKLRAGPAWDYNLAWGNGNYCAGTLTAGWAYQFNQVCPPTSPFPEQVPFWWARLLQDPAFTNALQCRWTYLRQRTLHRDSLFAFIDAQAQTLSAAKDRHFLAWPILGFNAYFSPTPIPATYADEVLAQKRWLSQRLLWLDDNMPGLCSALAAAPGITEARLSATVYPNPFTSGLVLGLTLPAAAVVQVDVLDATGRRVAQTEAGPRPAGHLDLPLTDMQALPPGLYVVRVSAGEVTLALRAFRQ